MFCSFFFTSFLQRLSSLLKKFLWFVGGTVGAEQHLRQKWLSLQFLTSPTKHLQKNATKIWLRTAKTIVIKVGL